MPPRRYLLAVASSAIGAVLIVIGLTVLPAGRAADFGSVASTPTATSGMQTPAGQPAAPTTAPSDSTDPAAPTPTVAAAASASGLPSGGQPAQSEPGTPATLQLSALGVTADVVEVVIRNGELEVPSNPADVGWWIASALPGAANGTTVIDGHVDSAALGPGAFYELGSLTAGDIITISTSGGGTIRYTVDARRTYPKTGGLPPDLFDTDGPHRLILITCGGTFDRTTLSYDDNIVVLASPQPAQPAG